VRSRAVYGENSPFFFPFLPKSHHLVAVAEQVVYETQDVSVHTLVNPRGSFRLARILPESADHPLPLFFCLRSSP